ncbi:Wzz/FepE/Etk N-terminal domain-containing protein [Muribaculum gordoncarteri]|uniref:Wzz/FepE/Etk N-terminal domain-containing protein n=1 Tax=Muribaculum gordoncarteri TaxID=2530390 RepID=UPI00248AB566|nr:Wzz/FepE/Etk N-terminal domain-containing protein [Muribaculum gordoncarteri]
MTQQNDNIDNMPNQEEEIDLLELARKLWDSRRMLIRWGIAGAVIGLIVAFSIPREYTTTIKLAPEANDGKAASGGLGALASMAGISMGTGGGADAVYPQLYPDVVSSVSFVVGLFDVNLVDKEGNATTVRQYLEEDTSAPWWSAIMSLPGTVIGGVKSLFTSDDEVAEGDSINIFHLSPKENDIVLALSSRISANVDTKTSVITLSSTMQDPVVSAMLADTIAMRLREYVTEYRTNKARQDMEYAQKLNDEARDEYYKAQQRYADYTDKNQGLILRSAQTERDRLQNESSLAFNLYNQTAQQLQMAKAKVQQTTPVYTVVQPATVPLRPSKPSKVLILVGFVFLAVVAASAWILFGKDMVNSFRNKKVEKSEEAEK